MKIKLLLIAILFAFVSCSDDEDTYDWEVLWVDSITSAVDGSIVQSDTLYKGTMQKTEEDAYTYINAPIATVVSPSTDSEGNSLVVSDDIINESNLKSRTIVSYYPKNLVNDPDYPLAAYLKKVELICKRK